LVADSKSLKEETGLSSYVVDLKYADAQEVKTALQKLAADIEVDRGGNRLIVVTSPRVIAEIQSIVEKLDVPSRQVRVEARIVEVSTDDAKKLGIDWDLLNRRGFIFAEGTYDSTSGPALGADAEVKNLQAFPNSPGTHDIFKLNNFTRTADVYRVALDL